MSRRSTKQRRAAQRRKGYYKAHAWGEEWHAHLMAMFNAFKVLSTYFGHQG